VDRSDIIYEHLHWQGQIAQRDETEDVSQDAGGMRDVVESHFAVEIAIGACAGGE